MNRITLIISAALLLTPALYCSKPGETKLTSTATHTKKEDKQKKAPSTEKRIKYACLGTGTLLAAAYSIYALFPLHVQTLLPLLQPEEAKRLIKFHAFGQKLYMTQNLDYDKTLDELWNEHKPEIKKVINSNRIKVDVYTRRIPLFVGHLIGLGLAAKYSYSCFKKAFSLWDDTKEKENTEPSQPNKPNLINR